MTTVSEILNDIDIAREEELNGIDEGAIFHANKHGWFIGEVPPPFDPNNIDENEVEFAEMQIFHQLIG